MIPAYVTGAIVYSNLLMLLSIGFTFAYLTAKVPNFALGGNAAIGIYVSFTIARIVGLNPYLAVPVAIPVCGLASTLIYKGVIQPLKRRNAGLISLSIATIAAEMMIFAAINIYADSLSGIAGEYTRQFLLRNQDFTVMELPGVLVVSTLLAVTIVVLLHTMLTRTKFGIAIRATVENDDLASTLAINTELVSLVSWFVTGALAGVAGSLFPLWFQSTPYTGTLILMAVFAASVVGGMASIYGAIVGGYLVGLTQVLGTIFVMDRLGSWVAPYQPLVPLIVLFVVLLRAPEGLAGVAARVDIDRVRAGLFRPFASATRKGDPDV